MDVVEGGACVGTDNLDKLVIIVCRSVGSGLPPPPFVPKNHAHALEALEQRKSPDGSKLWVIP
jgi:hypothetical protein